MSNVNLYLNLNNEIKAKSKKITRPIDIIFNILLIGYFIFIMTIANSKFVSHFSHHEIIFYTLALLIIAVAITGIPFILCQKRLYSEKSVNKQNDYIDISFISTLEYETNIKYDDTKTYISNLYRFKEELEK